MRRGPRLENTHGVCHGRGVVASPARTRADWGVCRRLCFCCPTLPDCACAACAARPGTLWSGWQGSGNHGRRVHELARYPRVSSSRGAGPRRQPGGGRSGRRAIGRGSHCARKLRRPPAALPPFAAARTPSRSAPTPKSLWTPACPRKRGMCRPPKSSRSPSSLITCEFGVAAGCQLRVWAKLGNGDLAALVVSCFPPAAVLSTARLWRSFGLHWTTRGKTGARSSR